MPRAAPFPPIAALVLLVAACASAPPAPPRVLPPPVDEPFAIDGRLSARRGSEAVAVGFAWTHASPRDELVVHNPLGQALAELTSDASVPEAEVRMADGRRDVARDWATLTERAVGFALPVDGLVWWARGAPRAGTPHTVEFDRVGRPEVLRQDGCRIVYAYGDESTRRASRLDVVCHDLEVRIVIDRWRTS